MRVKIMNDKTRIELDSLIGEYESIGYDLDDVMKHLKEKKVVVVKNGSQGTVKRRINVGSLSNFEREGNQIYGDLEFTIKNTKKYLKELERNGRIFTQGEATLNEIEDGIYITQNVDIEYFHIIGEISPKEKGL